MNKTFEIKSGKIVLSDPCYEAPTWCQGVIDNVKNGKWEASVDKQSFKNWGERIVALYAFNVEAAMEDKHVYNNLVDITIYPNGFTPLPIRWVVERTFSWFDNDRRLCRDYELLAESSEAMVKLAAIKLLLNKI
jgi:transposase